MFLPPAFAVMVCCSKIYAMSTKTKTLAVEAAAKLADIVSELGSDWTFRSKDDGDYFELHHFSGGILIVYIVSEGNKLSIAPRSIIECCGKRVAVSANFSEIMLTSTRPAADLAKEIRRRFTMYLANVIKTRDAHERLLELQKQARQISERLERLIFTLSKGQQSGSMFKIGPTYVRSLVSDGSVRLTIQCDEQVSEQLLTHLASMQ